MGWRSRQDNQTASKIKALNCPTGSIAAVGNKAENRGLSNRSSLSKLMKSSHKRMSRMLGFCLTLDTTDAWFAFSAIAEARMTLKERAGLAFASLKSLDPEIREQTAAAALGAAGSPLPAFLGGMEDARFWASLASQTELKAYALASFEAMSPKDQAAFFRHIGTIEVAA